ncbi:hypothetical protein QYM36_013740 [Artemia franciscana]|uniref:Uncharacterized protein n=1 Tax=Artemia franciscana TaxID=6661 RepID=A0AA88HDS8_ARTSF|nr:hypothetical protein QYM36_013740 [Artemia franciscana]
MVLHREGRSKPIIEDFHRLGICISNDMYLTISDYIVPSQCQCYQSEGVVNPLKLKNFVLNVATGDNAYHNSTSTIDKLYEDELSPKQFCSWGSFHTYLQLPTQRGRSVSLVLSEDPTHSYAIIRQQLDKIAKELQWLMTDNYGEGKLVVMIRALHIEMTMDSVIGEVLSGIGWGQALIDIGVFPTGRCDTLEKGSNAKRSWYAYEVTVLALEELQGQAFCTLNLVIRLINLQLVLVKSFRTSEYHSYVATITKIVPFLFALDNQNYARWLSVHTRDLQTLNLVCPSVYREFEAGKLVVSATGKQFSSIPLDQANEFNHKTVKDI